MYFMRYEIKGGNFPVVVCNLENGEKMITEKGSMVWMSPNSRDLLELLHRRCRDAGILHDNPSVFRYLQEMEIKQPQQMSLFE